MRSNKQLHKTNEVVFYKPSKILISNEVSLRKTFINIIQYSQLAKILYAFK